jgi:hypothetical protein
MAGTEDPESRQQGRKSFEDRGAAIVQLLGRLHVGPVLAPPGGTGQQPPSIPFPPEPGLPADVPQTFKPMRT